MNNKLKLLFFSVAFVCLLLCSCNTTLLYKSSLYVLQCRTKNMINMFLKRADTVYCYSSGFDDYYLIWYHKDNYLYSYYVRPYKTVKYKPQKVRNITIDKKEIDKYSYENERTDTPCFFILPLHYKTIDVYFKNKEIITITVDSYCLFTTKFAPNSFPYKLQYDISRIWIINDFDFEKMYSDE